MANSPLSSGSASAAGGSAAASLDPAKLDAFMQRFVGDLGAAMSASLVVLGDRLGLYRAMDAAGHPLTSGGAGRDDQHRRAVCAGVAERAGGVGVCGV